MTLDSPARRRQVSRVVVDRGPIVSGNNGNSEFQPLHCALVCVQVSIDNGVEYVPWVTAPTIDKWYWDSDNVTSNTYQIYASTLYVEEAVMTME